MAKKKSSTKSKKPEQLLGPLAAAFNRPSDEVGGGGIRVPEGAVSYGKIVYRIDLLSSLLTNHIYIVIRLFNDLVVVVGGGGVVVVVAVVVGKSSEVQEREQGQHRHVRCNVQCLAWS